MSTMVQTPVRMKPPPALTGEIISPGWASVETATPLNGARMTVSSRAGPLHVDLAPGHDHLLALVGDPRPERVRLGLRHVEIRLSDQALVQQPALPIEVETDLLVAHIELGQGAPRWPSWTSASARYERSVVLSRRARTEPSVTVIPSSTSTSTVRPRDLGGHGRL